jgi:hypothetical protein
MNAAKTISPFPATSAYKLATKWQRIPTRPGGRLRRADISKRPSHPVSQLEDVRPASEIPGVDVGLPRWAPRVQAFTQPFGAPAIKPPCTCLLNLT